MEDRLKYKLEKILDSAQVLQGEPMKQHTSFKIGGPAEYFVMPRSVQEVKQVVALCLEEGKPYYVMGNGSNLLVSDQGYEGVIIQLGKQFSQIRVEGEEICACAGASLARIAAEALRSALTGFEFAAGIPGTLGGACIMNAGAYGGEMKDVLQSMTVLTKEGEILTLPREELDMGYRTSAASRRGYVVLGARIKLERGTESRIRACMEDLKERRTSKQPLEYPSAGSTFKRPEGYFAGKLIQDAGLRGFRIGDAMVSEKHCGFVINCGDATAAQVDELIREVARRVKETSGVTLEPEVRRLGEF